MQIVNANGARLSPKLFITIYRIARKLAPPRFLTMRLHPDRYKELFILADVPESIQLGSTMGPLGRPIMRVCCIVPPLGVNDGIAILQDKEADPSRLEFQIHGILDLVLENISYESPSPSPERVSENPS